jgi:beta-lactamase class A
MRHFRISLIVLVLLAVGLIAGGDSYASRAGDQVLKATGITDGHTTTSDDTKAVAASSALPNLVSDMNTAIATDPNVSSAATLIDLDTGQEYDAGQTTVPFTAASTTKILTAVQYLHEVEEGEASLDQDIDGESAQTLIQNMIEVSDNTAWEDLQDFLGAEQPYAASIGLTSFSGIYDNLITASDQAKLLAQLYQGKLINTSDRALLYSYMADTDSTNLISAALPADATVYHKYGQVDGVLNDAALVTYQGHHFALVIFTNNSDGTSDEYDSQVTLIHTITTAALKDISN